MKTFILNKKEFLFILAVTGLTALTLISLMSTGAAVAANASQKRLPIYSVNTQEKKIALTFDCAWENSDTQELSDLLDKYLVKATFFTTGDWCERYPDDVKFLFSKGHAIENHSYNHPHVASIDAESLIEDTKKCDDIIEDLTGRKPILYRAPYGEYSNVMLKTMEDNFEHKVIQWDCDSVDWKGREVDEMVATILKKVKNGSILLFHNDTKNTPQALEIIIPRLQEEGYEFVKVSDLIYWDNYTIDSKGGQTRL